MKKIITLCFMQFLLLHAFSLQNDTLLVPNVPNLPTIDGIADDACWNSTDWQLIDQVWIPLNTTLDSTDFYGRFKIVWSSATNLMYVLGETVDDIWVDGFVEGQTEPGVHEYDIFEIFLDEDRSGGLHIFDYYDDGGASISTNSENAYSYHIAINAPEDGESTNSFVAMDLDGTNWYPDIKRPNYDEHFEAFSAHKTGNKITWEIALGLYNDTYGTDPSTARVTITNNKISGMCIAYCDDDTPENIQRQSFIGSTMANTNYLDNNNDFNDCWRNADHYGVIKFIDEPTSIEKNGVNAADEFVMETFPNPTKNTVIIKTNGIAHQPYSLALYNTAGVQLFKEENKTATTDEIELSLAAYPVGVYLISLEYGIYNDVVKTIKIN